MMTGFRYFISAIAAVATLMGIAAAAVVVDQEQPLIDEAAGFQGVGGDSEQKLAQTFIVGVNGDLAGLRLPIAGCGRGELLIEIREQDAGRPTGPLLRAVTIPGSDIPVSFSGFTDLFFRVPLAVNAGDALAFTVQTVGEDSYCSYATSPDGDLYARGNGFFDSRPNPPGWLSFKEFPGMQDLAFFTLMDDPSGPGRSAGNCVIPGRIDPATGMPLTLPISRFVPACRCFEDAGAREFRCGVLHPDFFIVRRFPTPLTPGKSFEEVWQFTPLTKLDGPVRVTLTGGAFEKPVEFEFAAKRKLSTYSKQSFRRTFTAKAVAPLKPVTLPGVAIIEYEMEDADNEHLKKFGLDTTIEEDHFGQ